MITVEQDSDETVVTILDSTGLREDVQLIGDMDGWYIRQWSEELGSYDLIMLSEEMLAMMFSSMDLTEGVYSFNLKGT